MEANPQSSSQHSARQAWLLALAAVLLWSTVATGFKLGMAAMPLVQLLLLGTSVSWLVFAAYAWQQRCFALTNQQAGLAVLLGLLNPLAYYLVLFAAYARLPAHVAQPLNYTWAITLALLAIPVLKQPLGRRTLLGILVSYAGVVLLLSGEHSAPLDKFGVALALFSTLLWAGYWLLLTRSSGPPAAIMFWSFTAALPPLLLICLLGPGWPVLNWSNLGYGAWIGCVEMGVTFILWQQALRKTQHTARLSQLIFLSPVISMFFIHNILDEQIGWHAISGLLLILAGILLARQAEIK